MLKINRQQIAAYVSVRISGGSSEDILFKRLYHWTVINPKSGAAISQQNGDAFAEHASFEIAVSALSEMIERFDRRAHTIGVEQHNVANSTEDRLLQAYEDWGLGNESMDAFPVPPDTPGNSTTKPTQSMRYPKPTLVPG